MNYLKVTIWIFVVLLLVVFLMLIFPSEVLIFVGTAALPVIIVIQAIIILKARDESKDNFSDKWYDR